MTVKHLLNNINEFILNPLILLLFAIALIVFFFGIFQFISSETADASRDDGKRKILYGLIGMFIMFSAYGLINFLLKMFGISGETGYINF